MGFKTITIKEDVYDKIKQHKQEGESFSDLFDRTFDEKQDIMQFAGAWSDMSDEEAEQIKQRIREQRGRADENHKRRMERLYGETDETA